MTVARPTSATGLRGGRRGRRAGPTTPALPAATLIRAFDTWLREFTARRRLPMEHYARFALLAEKTPKSVP